MPDPRPVLVPFRDPSCSALLDYDIRWEVRRLRCGAEPGTLVVMYCSTTRLVTGAFFCGEVLSMSPDDLWPLVSEGCGLTEGGYREWFGSRRVAHALELTAVRRLPEAFSLGFNCPRSFQYLDDDVPAHARVLDLVYA